MLSAEHIALEGARKFIPKWLGPYRIAERVGELAYRLELPPNMRLHPVFNVSRLKKYVRRGNDGFQPPPPMLAESEDGSEFEIECIVAQRGSGWRK